MNTSVPTFLNIDITVKVVMFVYKLLDKRDALPFSMVRMPYIDSNILNSIFYSVFVGEFLLYKSFNETGMQLPNRMKAQGP